MQFNCKMGYSGNEQDYQLIKTSISELKKSNNQKEVLRYLTNVLPNPTNVVTLDNAQDTVKSVKAQLANKNLLPYPYAETTKTQNGITFTDNGDGSITISGKAERDAYFRLCIADFGNKPISAITADSATNGIYTASKRLYYNNISKVASINILSGATVDETIYPQIELGSTATAYTPYISDFSTVKVSSCGKNFIDIDSIANDIVEKNPTTCEITDFDGKRCLKIGATSTIKYTIQTSIPLYGLQLKVYSMGYSASFMGYTKKDTGTSVFYINVSAENEWVNIKRYYPAVAQYYTEIQFYKTDATKPIYIDLDSVMLEASHTATDYEPYQGQTYTPTATGEATGIEVLTPTTNIINDKGLLFTKVTGDDFNYIN